MPVGVFISCTIISLSSPVIRSGVSVAAPLDYTLNLTFKTIGMNIWPLIVFTIVIVLLLWHFTRVTTKAFILFGWLLNAAIKVVFVLAVVELITGGTISFIFRGWGFDPIVADAKDQFRALEVSALISLVLAGGYPLVYILKAYASKPISKAGAKIGLDSVGTLGLLASLANVLVMFLLIKDMKPRDKVLNVAFSVCGAFLIGDHLAYNLNIQPGITISVFVGKLIGGIVSMGIAHYLCKRKLHLLEDEEAVTEVREDRTLGEMILAMYQLLLQKVNRKTEVEMVEVKTDVVDELRSSGAGMSGKSETSSTVSIDVSRSTFDVNKE
jgi:ethanolamine transporter